MTHLSPKRYKAFISYRHLSPDKEIAHALHKLLEHNMVRPHCGVKRNIRPVFLDTSELPLLEDLNQGILSALDQSESLIVICSPNLPLSKYCMAEIRYFKQLHGGSMDRIYTILVDGEPSEAFPEALRTTVKRIVLPNGDEMMETVPAEPLFADVRGKNLWHSLWKLYRKEYLRIAAACYQCSFDQLYKRHKRWIISVAFSVLLAAGVIGYGFQLNSQRLETNTITSHVQQLVEQGDELLAMTLSQEAEFTNSQTYQSALRSALVQYDYKLKGTPVSSFHLANILPDFNTVRYLSDQGDKIITYAGARLQITDMATGTVLLNEPQDQVFVAGRNPEIYVRFYVKTDADGVMRDYVSVYQLSDNRLLGEFSFREAERAAKSYRLTNVIGYDGAFAVADGDRAVAYFKRDGTQLTDEAFLRDLLENIKESEEGENALYTVVRDKLLRTFVVKDSGGRGCLTLGENVKAFAINADSSLFAWADESGVFVYDTATWEQLSVVSLTDGGAPQKMYLLEDSTYYIASHLDGGVSYNNLCDWKTGDILLRFSGNPEFNHEEQAFFTAENARIVRYNYQQLDIEKKSSVFYHAGTRCLSRNNNTLYLTDSQQQELLLEFPLRWYEDAAYDAGLTCVLLRDEDGLHCFSADGTERWHQSGELRCQTVSDDGVLVAWVEEGGDVVIADAAAGREVRRISTSRLEQIGELNALALSSQGICAVGESGTVWFETDSEEPCPFSSIGYEKGTWFSDGILVLEDPYERIKDFLIYDAEARRILLEPDSNTGLWAYSPASGYLVREVKLSNDQPTMMVEVFKRKGSGFSPCGTITLPFEEIEYLVLDHSGEWLSILGYDRTLIYRIPSMEEWLNVQCGIYCQGDTLYSATAYGPVHYSIPMYTGGSLRDIARDVLSMPSGLRSLTQAERLRYGIDTP